jgi:hypothetical protein
MNPALLCTWYFILSFRNGTRTPDPLGNVHEYEADGGIRQFQNQASLAAPLFFGNRTPVMLEKPKHDSRSSAKLPQNDSGHR